MLRDNCILSESAAIAKADSMANVLKAEKQLTILNLLVEGNSVRSVNRLTGVHLQTICNLILRFGDKCRDFLDREMRDLTCEHLELDEQWTYVAKKQARLTTDERAERADVGDMFLWLAVDHDTKLVPTFAIGKRSADNARRFLMDIASRFNFPNPHASDRHAYDKRGFAPVVQISSDAFAAYREAVDLAFGPYAKYGQIIKDYRNANMIYTPSEMVGTERRGIRGISDNELNTICTSHIERFNCTTRLFMKRMNRLTLCFSKKLDNLAAAVAMHVAYYNYCWHPATLGKGQTPAKAAGLVDRRWTFQELFAQVQV